MAIKKKASKKKVSKKPAVVTKKTRATTKKKVVAKKKVGRKKVSKKKTTAVDRTKELRETLKTVKAQNKELGKQLKDSERRVIGLMRLLAATQKDADKFLAGRVADAVKKYGVMAAPKKRRRRRTKKKAASK